MVTACAGGGARPRGVAAPASVDGATLLRRACTACHDLGGLGAYADYWGESEWRSMVETMLSYGARLTAEEVAVLSRYLAVRYGTGSEGEGLRL